MQKYILKAEDQEITEEALELFQQLGYELGKSDRSGMIFTQDGKATCDRLEFWNYYKNQDGCQELTLPQLRDLVVLKRNDVRDATHTGTGDSKYYVDSNGDSYIHNSIIWTEWKLDISILKPIKKHLETATGRFDENGDHHLTFSKGSEEKDPSLISGADVPALIKKGESVQFRSVFNVQGGSEWKDFDLERDEEEFSLGDLINTRFEWRLKPKTIKLNGVEVPAPIKTGVESDSGVLVLFKNNEDRDKFLKAMGY
ncbi:hypothetical protein Q5X70_08415 [Acinetobacter baumannii]|nr:hypothetical protein [Acinetobacter baumannii]